MSDYIVSNSDEDYLVIPSTFWRRRLVAQQKYIQLIQFGFLNHNLKAAQNQMYALVGRAFLEGRMADFKKRI